MAVAEVAGAAETVIDGLSVSAWLDEWWAVKRATISRLPGFEERSSQGTLRIPTGWKVK